MRMILTGLTGWARMDPRRSHALRTTDAAITLTGTLLAAATYVLLHHR